MNRFFVEPKDIGPKFITIDTRDDVHHITKVLRLREEDMIQISDGDKFEYMCQISYIGDDCVEAQILDKQSFAKEPKLRITLFQGIPKQGKLDLTVQKATELGVDTIVPVFMDRTVVQDKGSFWKKVIRFRTIAAEAAKQCGRGTIPEIRKETTFDDMIERLVKFPVVIFPYENEENLTIKDALRNLEEVPQRLAIIIGPEGGFSPEEARKLKEAQTYCVSLGKTTLRTETAGIAAIAMTMYELEL